VRRVCALGARRADARARSAHPVRDVSSSYPSSSVVSASPCSVLSVIPFHVKTPLSGAWLRPRQPHACCLPWRLDLASRRAFDEGAPRSVANSL
jgi:hypothetical protein